MPEKGEEEGGGRKRERGGEGKREMKRFGGWMEARRKETKDKGQTTSSSEFSCFA